jgi:hypothetical protein
MSETFIEYVLFGIMIAYEPAPLKPEASSRLLLSFGIHACPPNNRVLPVIAPHDRRRVGYVSVRRKRRREDP